MIKSIQDLAAAANVSTATVSRALHNSGYVNEETKATHPRSCQKRRV